MSCFQDHWRRHVMFERVFPAGNTHAPFVAWFQAWKTPFRMWRDQIVSVEDGEVQKLARCLDANRMETHVLWAGAAVAVAVKPG